MKNILLLILTLIVASCGTGPKFDKALNLAVKQCDDKKNAGIYKTQAAEIHDCEIPQLNEIESRYPVDNYDLLSAALTRKEVLAEQVDSKKITQAQMDDQLNQYRLQLVSIDNQRKAEQVRQQQIQDAIQALQPRPAFVPLQIHQLPTNIAPTQQSHCRTYASGSQLNTDCY